MKLFAPGRDNPLFPNDPHQEADVLRELSGTGLAPEFLAGLDTDLGRCIVYRHLQGDLWTSGTIAVGNLMRKLHQRPPSSNLRRVDTSPAFLERQALTMSEQTRDLLPLLPQRPRLAARPPVFLHGDIVAGNLIRSADGLTLIDWQAPGAGDPCHDIAVFLSPAMMQLYRGTPLSTGEMDGFFRGYGSQTICQRYRLLAPWLHLRMLAYCHWKAAQGDMDYRAAARAELDGLHHSLAHYPSQSLTA